MSRYWEIETRLDDNTNVIGNGNLDYEEYGQIAILLNKYVRKEEGKGLSTNDFTDAYREKLDSIEDNAQVNVLETISVNGGEKLYPDEEKNIDIFVPTKTSEIENDLVNNAVDKINNGFLSTKDALQFGNTEKSENLQETINNIQTENNVDKCNY